MSAKHLSDAADDFKVIKGIGPATERRLHQAGVRTYAQLAASIPSGLAKSFEGMVGMSAERIAQEDWIGQARSLLPEPASASPQPDVSSSGNGQHYATFTVELLLDDKNQVRRTRVAHVQGTSKDTWAGWQAERLTNFIVEYAELPLPADESVTSAATGEPAATPTPIIASPPAAPNHLYELRLEPVDLDRMTFVQTGPTPPPPATPLPPAVSDDAVHHAQAHTLKLEPVDLDRMIPAKSATPPLPERPAAPLAQRSPQSASLQVIPVGAKSPRALLHHDESFNVHLTLDLPEVAAAEKHSFNYKATLYAENLSGGPRQMVGERFGSIAPAKDLSIDVPGHIATPGTYRLEAVMTVTSMPPSADWGTSLKGSLLHVY